MILDADGYYSYTVTGFTSLPIGVVFNNGAATSQIQTVDLSASGDMCWDAGALSGTKYTATEVTCLTTGLSENQVNASFEIYPNPTHDFIYFNVPTDASNITINSVTGSKLEVKPEIILGSCRINLSGYPSGTYFISLSGANGKRVTKAVMKY